MKYFKSIISLKPELLFIMISLFFGTISAFAVPQLSVNDETAHFKRSYSVSTANIMGETCTYPQEIIDKIKDVRKDEFSFNISEENTKELVTQSCESASNYSPMMHLPQAIGIFIAKVIQDSPGLMVLLGRLANLLFYAGAMYLIIRFAVVGKWVFFVLGLLPLSIHTAASLSYDTFNIIAIFAFIALMLNLYIQKRTATTKQILLLFLLSILLTTAKTSNLVLLPLVFILPLSLFKKHPTKYSDILNKLLVTFGIILASIICMFLWKTISGVELTNDAPNRVSENPFYFLVILYNTYVNPFLGYNDVVTRGIVGEFSSFKYHLPTFLVVTSYGLIAFALLTRDDDTKRYATKKIGLLVLASVAVFVTSILVITYGLYDLWATLPSRYGPDAYFADGVQGRYFTPLLALLIPVGVWLMKYIRIVTMSTYIQKGIIIATSVLLLCFYSVQTILFLARV